MIQPWTGTSISHRNHPRSTPNVCITILPPRPIRPPFLLHSVCVEKLGLFFFFRSGTRGIDARHLFFRTRREFGWYRGRPSRELDQRGSARHLHNLKLPITRFRTLSWLLFDSSGSASIRLQYCGHVSELGRVTRRGRFPVPRRTGKKFLHMGRELQHRLSTNQRIGVGFLLYQDFGEEIMRDGFCFQCSVQRHDISPDLSPSGLPESLGVDRERCG